LVDVLIVDDEPGISKIVRLMLQSEGLDVAVKDNGSTALDFIEAEPVRLVLLDLNMPEMDGREFFRLLRQRGFHTPVIIMSAHGARTAAREIGADAYLDKPFLAEDLVACVEKLS
jgi:two-component system, OmpR family, response regulator MtrA